MLESVSVIFKLVKVLTHSLTYLLTHLLTHSLTHSRQLLEKISRTCFRKRYAAGEYVYRLNDEANLLYMLLEGNVSIIKTVCVTSVNRWPTGMNSWYSLTHSPTHSLTHLLTHSLTYLLTHSLTYLLTYLLTYSLTHLLTYSLTHSEKNINVITLMHMVI